jgi:tRNA(fMet)-specific endonuclease VapC
MAFLLDTNIVSDLLRHPHGRVAGRIPNVANQTCTSIIVVAELRFGIMRRKSTRLAARLATVLEALEVLPLESPVDVVYGALRTELETAGTPIGANDLLIAAHALALGYTLVTDNVREFSRIKGLAVENWLR